MRKAVRVVAASLSKWRARLPKGAGVEIEAVAVASRRG